MTSRILERLSLRKGNKVWEESAWREVDVKSVGWKQWAKPSQNNNKNAYLNCWDQSSQLSQRLSTHRLLLFFPGVNWSCKASNHGEAVELCVSRTGGWKVSYSVPDFCVCKKESAVRLMPGCPRLQKTPIIWRPSLILLWSFFYLDLVERTPWLRVFQSQFPSGGPAGELERQDDSQRHCWLRATPTSSRAAKTPQSRTPKRWEKHGLSINTKQSLKAWKW